MGKELKIKQIVQWGKLLVCLGEDGMLYYLADVKGPWVKIEVENIDVRKVKEIRYG